MLRTSVGEVPKTLFNTFRSASTRTVPDTLHKPVCETWFLAPALGTTGEKGWRGPQVAPEPASRLGGRHAAAERRGGARRGVLPGGALALCDSLIL